MPMVLHGEPDWAWLQSHLLIISSIERGAKNLGGAVMRASRLLRGDMKPHKMKVLGSSTKRIEFQYSTLMQVMIRVL